MQEAIEHGAYRCTVTQQFSPVVYGSVGSDHSAGAFVASHDDLQKLLRRSDG